MSGSPAGLVPADGTESRRDTEVCMLLACFRGVKGAARARREVDKQITEAGNTVLDEVVLEVDARHRARVYDPRRVLAGTLTPALTWGVFGLLTGGIASAGLWAIIGAVCGGLFAYYAELLFTKDEMKRLGRRLPGNSSAIAAFVQAGDARRVLASTAPCDPAEASVAAIGADLSARVLAGPAMLVQTSSAPACGGPVPAAENMALTMLMLRYRGADSARRVLARHGAAHDRHRQPVQAELVFQAPERGRLKVSDPTQGAAAFGRSDLISWGLFGVAYGLIAGVVSNHGIFGAVKDAVAAGVVCAVFGLAAGALYGLWAGRAVSARRLKRLRPILPRGTSTVLAWSEVGLTSQVTDSWSEPGSQRLIVRFNPVSDGALLEV